MILSASRRTDIPAFFPDWFMNRLRDGYVLVRNPMNYHQVSKIELSPAVLDCIVFWTKNPRPILRHLTEIGETYPFYFQYTLNAYEKDVEQNLPNLGERIRTPSETSESSGVTTPFSFLRYTTSAGMWNHLAGWRKNLPPLLRV